MHVVANCTEIGCDGSYTADGYCDTCGMARRATSSTTTPAATNSPAAPPPPLAAAATGSCPDATCTGSIAADGYCDTCGLEGGAAMRTGAIAQPDPSGPIVEPTIAAPAAPTTSRRLNPAGGSGVTRRTSSTGRAVGSGLGAGLVSVPPTTAGDPAAAVMSQEKIAAVLGEKPEDERFCSACGQPVGRASGDKPGRVTGFCSNCRTPFDFVTNMPSLSAGELVGGQYEILGPIAHGGMGWIYLGRDRAVSNRWVVLKGLLNEDDPDAVASAVAERQFLARIEHGSIVNIYNFVTWRGAGYIVMEFVGGQSLNSKLKDRRRSNGGTPDPLPLTDAIAYMLGVLPAIGYLHEQGLVYNDLKPANMMAVGDGVKLIDVGGVMAADDQAAAIFGTQGFQAPEVAEVGPSVASDLFTVGRTLAVLTLNFVYHQGPYLHTLPPVGDQPVFGRFESFHRFLLKATAPHPDDRFQSADAMAEQLTGVLREVVAISTGSPKPTVSSHFSGDRLAARLLDDESDGGPDWRTLPVPSVDPNDQAAPFLADLAEDEPPLVLSAIAAARREGLIEATQEVRFQMVAALAATGQDASEVLREAAEHDPWDWRLRWYRGLLGLRIAKPAEAAEDFSAVWTELPGELAPKVAVGLAAELAGEFDRAAEVYGEVIAVDPSFVSAAFGLARCRSAAGDRRGAVDAYLAVPESSAAYTEARVASARALVDTVVSKPSADDVHAAAATIESARLDAAAESLLAAEVLEGALVAIEAGALAEDPQVRVFDQPMTANGLRSALERTYRALARVASTPEEQFALVDKANAVRVPSLF